MNDVWKAFLIVPLFLCFIIGVTFSVGYLVVAFSGIPLSFGFSFLLRLFGFLGFLLGTAVVGWVFKHRNPKDIVVSTYATLLTAVKKEPLIAPQVRREPLIVQGPYKYTRNPMYLGVILWWTGLWLIFDYTPFLVSAAFIFLVFYFIVIPLEEKELKALFGEEYEEYAKRVRKLIPFIL